MRRRCTTAVNPKASPKNPEYVLIIPRALYTQARGAEISVSLQVGGWGPGSRVTGYGIIEKGGNYLQWVAYGEIKPPQHAALSICLKTICGKIANITEEEKPDAIAVEDIFYGKNVKSLIKQGHVRGAIILTCSQMGIPVFEYTPLEIKQAVVGYGRAEKSQVQTMVRAILKIPETIRADAADALAIAICHANFSKVSSL